MPRTEAARHTNQAAVELRRAFARLPEVAKLRPPEPGRPLVLSGLYGAAKALLVAALRERLHDRPFLVCVAEAHEVEEWREDLLLFSPPRAGRPPPKVLPVPEEDDEGRPLPGSLLARGELTTGLVPGEVCLAELSALMAPVLAPDRRGRRLDLAPGRRFDPEALTRELAAAGYHRTAQVCSPGEVARRGDVLDLFPFGRDEPVRIEFFDDEIESLRSFDVESQASTGALSGLELVLAGPDRRAQDERFPLELFEGLVTVVEPVRIDEHLARFTLRAGTESPAAAALRRRLAALPALSLTALPAPEATDMGTAPAGLPPVEGADLKGRIQAVKAGGLRPLIVLRSPAEAARVERLAREIAGGRDPGLDTTVGTLSRGFKLPRLERVVLHHGEFFGTGAVLRRRSLPKRRHAPARALAGFFDLAPGDLVVHAVHGIGRFVGLERGPRGLGGGEEDHLRLEFAGGVQILVPASTIDLVQKYVGSGDVRPKLDRIGGKAFGRRKAQVQRALRDMAAELLEIQIARRRTKGFACPPEDPLFDEFVAAFPYEDTPDQERATRELCADLTKPEPMDRLLCGDVGFGKTEIAVRAAFRVVSAGRQVAVLVPTTLLAEQHGRTFADRMAGFAVRCAVLSRLQTPGVRRRVLEELAAGRIDVVIGTHRLLSHDVRFKDLGLLIVDEEQRFGVAQKERIKKLRASVDVLTLTATPIPRTLHMALLGLRDISSLNTPPPGRLEIRTKVAPRSAALIRHAVLEEIRRGGQVFYLHNRVHDLELVRAELEKIVPEARIVTGHGRMREQELLANMRRFLAGDADVLLSTTIVESGLDIPRANTILVDHADRFGLAELHQLRGRVGRDVRQASCWLLVDPAKPLSPEAKARLDAMVRFSGLGAGFSLAMRDLEIRGAGNLLGPEQSGHIAAVGYDMYCRLLQAAVERAREGRPAAAEAPPLEAAEVDLDLGVSAYVPEDLVPEPERRIALLRELDEAADAMSHRRVAEVLADRFGRLPEPLANLLDLFLLKHLLSARGVRGARFQPPDRVVLAHPPERAPEGAWLAAFADVRPVGAGCTHLLLPPKVRSPERVLELLLSALSGGALAGRLAAAGPASQQRRAGEGRR